MAKKRNEITTAFTLRRGRVMYVGGYKMKIVRIRRGEVDLTFVPAGPMLACRFGIDDEKRAV